MSTPLRAPQFRDPGRRRAASADRHGRPATARVGRLAWTALTALACSALACTSALERVRGLPEIDPDAHAPAAAARPWTPAPSDVEAVALRGETPPPPADLAPGAPPASLPQLIDIGLRTNPETRQAWARARARAAAYGASRADYYPALGAGFAFGHEKNQAHQGALPYEETPYGPYLTLSFLLLDFGGRSATAESARQALLEANWQHNQRIQDVILAIAQAYDLHVAAKAQLAAAKVSLAEAETSYAAADERFKTGIGILADALAARAAAAQAKLAVEDRRGQVEITHGNLATALGLPANSRFEVAPPSHPLQATEARLGVDRLIEIAREQRPDLQAQRAAVRARESAVRVAESNALPTLSALGTLNHTFFASRQTNSQGQTVPGGSSGGNTDYTAALDLSYPLFQGFGLTNAIRQAKDESAAAQAALDATDERVVSQVWNSYFDFETAAQKLHSARDLLQAAEEAYDVSLGSYRAGVLDVVELLQTQTLLARARAEDILADAQLRVALAQLIHDTGGLLAVEWSPDAKAQPGVAPPAAP